MSQSMGAVYSNNDTGSFDACTTSIRDHVLDTYLKAKLGNILGISPSLLMWGNPITFTHPYANSEGVIKTHEMVKGLRIDLQKAQTHNDSTGTQRTYACIQVQYGTGMKTGGAYAGALIQVNKVFSVLTVRDALEKSFAWRKYCRVDPPAVAT